MIPYETYKLIHILAVFFLLFSLGAYLILTSNKTTTSKKLAGITHGIAIVVIFIGGFGLLARLGFSGISSWPLWVWIKILIWIILTLMITLIKRKPEWTTLLWFIIPILGGIAAFMAIYKLTL